jgi:hypothetical protein
MLYSGGYTFLVSYSSFFFCFSGGCGCAAAAGYTERIIIHIHPRRRQNWSSLRETCNSWRWSLNAETCRDNLMNKIRNAGNALEYLLVILHRIRKNVRYNYQDHIYIYLKNHFLSVFPTKIVNYNFHTAHERYVNQSFKPPRLTSLVIISLVAFALFILLC